MSRKCLVCAEALEPITLSALRADLDQLLGFCQSAFDDLEAQENAQRACGTLVARAQAICVQCFDDALLVCRTQPSDALVQLQCSPDVRAQVLAWRRRGTSVP